MDSKKRKRFGIAIVAIIVTGIFVGVPATEGQAPGCPECSVGMCIQAVFGWELCWVEIRWVDSWLPTAPPFPVEICRTSGDYCDASGHGGPGGPE